MEGRRVFLFGRDRAGETSTRQNRQRYASRVARFEYEVTKMGHVDQPGQKGWAMVPFANRCAKYLADVGLDALLEATGGAEECCRAAGRREVRTNNTFIKRKCARRCGQKDNSVQAKKWAVQLRLGSEQSVSVLERESEQNFSSCTSVKAGGVCEMQCMMIVGGKRELVSLNPIMRGCWKRGLFSFPWKK